MLRLLAGTNLRSSCADLIRASTSLFRPSEGRMAGLNPATTKLGGRLPYLERCKIFSAASRNGFDQLVDAGFSRHPLGDHAGDGLEPKAMLDPLAHRLADEDRSSVLLVQSFEASRQVHAVPERRVIHALGRTHISHHGISEMNAETNGEWRQSLGFKSSIECVARRLGRKRGATGPLDMIELGMGSVPKHHHRISDELVDGSALSKKRFRQRGEMARCLVHQTIGFGRFRYARKIGDV